MTPKQLHYFSRIAEAGSFARAARELYIAQPSLSQQIANLEDELGVAVFQRLPRGIELTESGQKLLEHAYSILRHIDAAIEDVSSSETNPSGVVVTGLAPALCNLLPLLLVDEIEQRFPNITCSLKPGLTSALNEWIRAGTIDVGVLYKDLADTSDLNRVPLIREDMYFVAAANKKNLPIKRIGKEKVIKFSDLGEFEFDVPPTRESLGYHIQETENDTNVTLKKRTQSGSIFTSISYVLEGRCESILPWTAIYHLVELGALQAARIVEPEIKRDVLIYTSRDRRLTNATQKVIEIIKERTKVAHQQKKWRGELLIEENA